MLLRKMFFHYFSMGRACGGRKFYPLRHLTQRRNNVACTSHARWRGGVICMKTNMFTHTVIVILDVRVLHSCERLDMCNQ